MTTSGPVAPLPLWDLVIHRAGHCCECTGACGKKHASTGGRCDRANGSYASKHRGPIRLLAAPADPAQLALPADQQARLTADALAAWCPTCHDTARTRATRAARQATTERLAGDSEALFTL